MISDKSDIDSTVDIENTSKAYSKTKNKNEKILKQHLLVSMLMAYDEAAKNLLTLHQLY